MRPCRLIASHNGTACSREVANACTSSHRTSVDARKKPVPSVSTPTEGCCALETIHRNSAATALVGPPTCGVGGAMP